MLSAGLKITGIDDFMRPEQECVVQTSATNTIKQPSKDSTIKMNSDGSFSESTQGKSQQLEQVKISLADCLACSGCLTSSETILVESQGVDEFIKNLNSGKEVIVSISSQSRASIGTHFGFDQQQTFKKLITMFHKLGVKYVFDTNYALELSLIESATEFIEKKRLSMKGEKTNLPILSGVCPGWVCYGEKSHGELITPYLSTTKSPQQVMGSIIKNYFGKNINKLPKDIYHASIMMCFDKKLEASREDFHNKETDSHDVDIVLVSSEILQLMDKFNIDFKTLPESTITDTRLMDINPNGLLQSSNLGGTSGGYLEYIFITAAKALFDVDIDKNKIEYKRGRNSDFVETSLTVNGEIVLRFARSNGFKNIQNIVRNLKQKKCNYDYIEVMACPGGCTNGGGQIGAQSGTQSGTQDYNQAKITLTKVNETFDQLEKHPPGLRKEVIDLYTTITQNPKERNEILRTQYHVIPKMEMKNPLKTQW